MEAAATTPVARVDVATIERELADLWTHLSDAPEGTVASVRVCTLNLVACAPCPNAANSIGSVVRDVTTAHPNRTFLLINEPDARESKLEAWVQANCQMSTPGTPQVCGEQISIHSYGSAVSQVAGLILSLLLPDLPVVLWWPGRAPFDSPLFNRLYHMIDRMIVDSATFTNPDRDLVDIATQLYPFPIPSPSGYVISDLNWLRLTPWRELITQFFDTRPLTDYLYRLDTIIIEYESAPDQKPNRIQAMLLVGWLATCLGWTPIEQESVHTDGAGVRLRLRRVTTSPLSDAVRVVNVEIRPVPVTHALHAIASVQLLVTDDPPARFVAERTGEPWVIRTAVEIDHQAHVMRKVHMEQPSDAMLLAEDLHLIGRDRILIQTLHIAGLLTQELLER